MGLSPPRPSGGVVDCRLAPGRQQASWIISTKEEPRTPGSRTFTTCFPSDSPSQRSRPFRRPPSGGPASSASPAPFSPRVGPRHALVVRVCPVVRTPGVWIPVRPRLLGHGAPQEEGPGRPGRRGSPSGRSQAGPHRRAHGRALQGSAEGPAGRWAG